MADWDKKLLWGFMFLLAGAVGQHVDYPGPVCAVTGSIVTLPCSFTPKYFFSDNGKIVWLKIIRVRWCRNHPICQGPTPSVYDSDPPPNTGFDPRYKYLGDKERTCTLEITDVKDSDKGTLRFRMEANHTEGHFTNQTGVEVTVTESTQMKIKSSGSDGVMIEGQSVTLQCTADCTFLPVKVKWYKNGNNLSEHGPALQIGSLTAKDSGNYTCELQSKPGSQSTPYSLQVEARTGPEVKLPLIVGVLSGVLLVVVAVIAGICIIKRRKVADENERAVSKEQEQKPPDTIYSEVELASDRRGQDPLPTEDVSYASVQFKHKNANRALEQMDNSVIYSSVVGRG